MAVVVAVVGLAAAAPLVLGTYWLRVFSAVFLYGTVASAINLMAGYTGYPAFGNVVFFGLGAYATAIVMGTLHGPLWSGLGLGVLLCSAFAVVVGLPVLRLRGHYFAIATLGMNEAMRRLVENLSGLTGGGMGLALPIPAGDARSANAYIYLLALALLVACLGTTAWLVGSRLGYGCRAIRFDEDSAANCGIPTMRYKVTMWVVSAAFTSVAGGIYAHWLGYIEAGFVFDMTIAVKCFVMALLGGMATVLGPLYGAVVVELLSLMAWSMLLTYHTA
ncbi:MAG TPA: branched-chain amino acid ABC transporter permease, partial [Gaiellales bacterium]|nr:branched-chain amino acid ABC transporter permease [Gaiellales bacterium]